jgi:phosphatidylserine decarboxylase
VNSTTTATDPSAPVRGRIPIAPEGWPFILGPALLGLAIWPWLPPLGATGWILALFCAYFFRDPERACAGAPDLVLSPADGKVVAIADEAGRPRLSIFLSLLDVHVNRAPVAGRVEAVEHRPGRFLVAWAAEASGHNEQTRLQLSSARGSVEVRQIAGILARRIVCRARPGQSLARGERFGLIRFGSRVDLLLPPGSSILARPGARVLGGASAVARLPEGCRR